MKKKGSKPKKSVSRKTFINTMFPSVVSLVEYGLTIRKALTKLCIDNTVFYKHITEEQKILLYIAKSKNIDYYRYKTTYVGSSSLSNKELFHSLLFLKWYY